MASMWPSTVLRFAHIVHDRYVAPPSLAPCRNIARPLVVPATVLLDGLEAECIGIPSAGPEVRLQAALVQPVGETCREPVGDWRAGRARRRLQRRRRDGSMTRSSGPRYGTPIAALLSRAGPTRCGLSTRV